MTVYRKPCRSHDEAAVELLRNDPDMIGEYLRAALDDIETPGGEAAFLMALKHVAMARGGITAIAENAGMKREAVARALSPRGNPTLRTLTAILGAMGVRLEAKPAARTGAKRRGVRVSARAA